MAIMRVLREYDEVKPSTYREDRIDFPVIGHQILRRFKLMNTPNWEKLKVFFIISELKFYKK